MIGFVVISKFQAPNPNYISILKIIGLIIVIIDSIMTNQDKKYDLIDRTLLFARDVRDYVDKLPKKVTNIEIGRQLVRSGGSVGANYIEADEALSKKDFLMRIKICRKEAKESKYWLELSTSSNENTELKTHLIDESTQLIKIFATIIKNARV